MNRGEHDPGPVEKHVLQSNFSYRNFMDFWKPKKGFGPGLATFLSLFCERTFFFMWKKTLGEHGVFVSPSVSLNHKAFLPSRIFYPGYLLESTTSCIRSARIGQLQDKAMIFATHLLVHLLQEGPRVWSVAKTPNLQPVLWCQSWTQKAQIQINSKNHPSALEVENAMHRHPGHA